MTPVKPQPFIPAQAGIQISAHFLDSRLRGNDEIVFRKSLQLLSDCLKLTRMRARGNPEKSVGIPAPAPDSDPGLADMTGDCGITVEIQIWRHFSGCPPTRA
jgi:hypothetical protein